MYINTYIHIICFEILNCTPRPLQNTPSKHALYIIGYFNRVNARRTRLMDSLECFAVHRCCSLAQGNIFQIIALTHTDNDDTVDTQTRGSIFDECVSTVFVNCIYTPRHRHKAHMRISQGKIAQRIQSRSSDHSAMYFTKTERV